MKHINKLTIVSLSLVLSLFATPLLANGNDSAAIAIIIDDIGHNLEAGKRIINSRWPYACSILPARPHSIALAQLAHQKNKEIMVHLPMQAKATHSLGYGALTSVMSKQDFIQSINYSIDAVPYAQGINNHMGSLLTSNTEKMHLLMQTIANRDEHLYFVDSKTSAQTVAGKIAKNYYIPNLERDIFLDAKFNNKEFVRKQLSKLVNIAKQKGYALAIGHPNLVTISILEQELTKLESQNVRLVTVNELIQIAKNKQWQMHSSRSRKVAKN